MTHWPHIQILALQILSQLNKYPRFRQFDKLSQIKYDTQSLLNSTLLFEIGTNLLLLFFIYYSVGACATVNVQRKVYACYINLISALHSLSK